MTREEAVLLVTNCTINSYDYDNLKFAVNKIYDDFESRTCENCKYGTKEMSLNSFTNKWKHNNMFKCYHRPSESIITHKSGFHSNPKDFGCNKFERRK